MGFESFRDRKYLNLETFKKSGQGVKTPIWFAADPSTDLAGPQAKLYAYTIGNSGKVKRLRNNGRARIAPCDMRGNLLGDWVDAQAEIITGPEAASADRLLNKKYWPWKQLLNFFASFRQRGRNCFVIRPA
jgi:PPOX class probable F420-dependent enzyme